MNLLISLPDSSGRDIDVYLCPLVDELKILWDTRVEIYDCLSKERFKMHAALMWIVNDFPAYGYLSCWSTSRYKACPTCNECMSYVRLRDKLSYVGHRRFLQIGHLRRRSRDFNGKPEHRATPIVSIGEDCLRQLETIPSVFGKVKGK